MHLIKKTVRSFQPPVKGFDTAIVTYPDGLVTLRIYENQIMGFTQDQRVAILLHLEKVQNAVRELGVRCELEGIEGDAPVRRRV